MIIARLLWDNRVQWGIVEGEDVLSVQGSVFGGGGEAGWSAVCPL